MSIFRTSLIYRGKDCDFLSELFKRFLTENDIEAEIHEISGSVEIAPNIGLADAICDLVSSGVLCLKAA